MGTNKFTILSAIIKSCVQSLRNRYGCTSERYTEDQLDKILYGSGEEKIYFRYENEFGQVTRK